MSPLKRTAENAFDEGVSLELFDPISSTPRTPRYSTRQMDISADELLPVDMLPDQSCILSPSASSDSSDGDHEELSAEREQTEREIFDKARHYLNPGPVLRYFIYLFGERKLLAFFCIHFACTLAIWGKCKCI